MKEIQYTEHSQHTKVVVKVYLLPLIIRIYLEVGEGGGYKDGCSGTTTVIEDDAPWKLF